MEHFAVQHSSSPTAATRVQSAQDAYCGDGDILQDELFNAIRQLIDNFISDILYLSLSLYASMHICSYVYMCVCFATQNINLNRRSPGKTHHPLHLFLVVFLCAKMKMLPGQNLHFGTQKHQNSSSITSLSFHVFVCQNVDFTG